MGGTVGCLEQLLTELAERAFTGVLVTWAALAVALDLSTIDKLRVSGLVLVGQLITGVLGSFVGDRCSASPLPDPKD